ncbi:MAG: winged helix-turn-helix transcriptional regulator [Nanoarchaeota archaeon]|nr:winged helix-turn-helix transcriptional regulator [Nanoarchaeota archaeon]
MGEDKDLVNLFLRNKPAFILIKIYSCSKKCYASTIAKEVDCTYSHTVRIIQILEKNKLLDFEKKGRIKSIILTKKGRKIAETIKKLITYIHED